MTQDNSGSKPIEFTPREILRMAENPDVLRALANGHDCWAMEAESMGFDDTFHINRAAQLNKEADRLDELYGC